MSDERSTREVKITTRNDRGFHNYGDDDHCTYGTLIAVYESSSAEGPHVWLELAENVDIFTDPVGGVASAHLNEEQARYLIARLQAWLDEIPKRWRGGDGD